MNTATIVQKLWNYCNVLRDDGMSYGDYVEQLTYLLFLKMADERSRPPYSQKSPVLAGYDWHSLVKRDGDELFDHYRHTLEELGKQKLARPDLHQVAEQVSGPGQAASADRRSDRQGNLGVNERRRERRRVRAPTGEKRAGHQVRRRPVLQAVVVKLICGMHTAYESKKVLPASHMLYAYSIWEGPCHLNQLR